MSYGQYLFNYLRKDVFRDSNIIFIFVLVKILFAMKIRLYIILLLLPVFCLFSCSGEKTSDNVGRQVDTLSLILQSVRSAKLFTAEYDIHKIVTKDDVFKVKGNVFEKKFDVNVPLGDRKILIPIDVTLKAYIDFAGFSESNVQRHGNHITLILPDPRVVVTSSKIDHYKVKQFVSLTRSDYTSAEINEFARQGEEAIIKTVPEMGILDRAQQNAAQVLIPMLMSLGYKEENIEIIFRKTFTQADMLQLWDRENQSVSVKR